MKTFCVLCLGYLVFRSPLTAANVAGTGLAVCGVLGYSYQKLQETSAGGNADEGDALCPHVAPGVGSGEDGRSGADKIELQSISTTPSFKNSRARSFPAQDIGGTPKANAGGPKEG